ncbi:MAG: M48 family metallopeptidase [Bacteroidota bacterium]
MRVRLAAALCAFTFAAALPGCATLAGVNYYSLDEEWELGRQVEAELNSELRLVSDPALTRYVQQMGQRMVRQTTLADRSWRFYVVADDAINAFNAPGGLVYINTGLIKRVGSAAELAGAMGHEVAHGLARHGTSRLSKANEANVVAATVLGGDPGIASQVAAQILAQGAFARFSRGNEREADDMGVQLMAATGYDPEGLVRLLQRLAEQEQGGGVAFFRSHPLSSERVQTVRQLAARYDGRGLRMNEPGFDAARRAAARY